MKVAIQDGLIKPTLTKSERIQLDKAEKLAELCARLSPVENQITDAAESIKAGLIVLRKHCVKEETADQPELPIMKDDSAEQAG